MVWLGAVAAGIAALALALALTRGHERRLKALDGEATRLVAELEGQRALVGMLEDPSARGIALTGAGPAPGARGRVLWHAPAGGLLLVGGLPSPPPGAVYQLWLLARTSQPVSAGLVTVDARGVGSLRLSPLPTAPAVESFVVTLEAAGGAAAPSGPVHLVTSR